MGYVVPVNTDEKIRGRLAELVLMGERVLATRRSPPQNFITDDFVDGGLANQWATSTSSLLSRVFGATSQHFVRFEKTTGKHMQYSDVFRAVGILRAAEDDYENGHLFEVRRLVEAEVFDDLLEQAEQLLANGYFQAAAVVAGCVLEDGLRKACVAKGIALSTKPKLDAMNADLAKAGLYTVLVQKQITALADLRNRAAHGQWGTFTRADVDTMLPSVRRLMAEVLT